MNTTSTASERGRLITRYSLTTSPLYEPVHAYLAPLNLPPPSAEKEEEAHCTFERLKASVTNRMEKDPGLQAALNTIAALPQGSISDSYPAAFEDIRQPDSDFARAYVSVLYATALQHLGRHVERDRGTFLATAQRAVRGLTGDSGRDARTSGSAAPGFRRTSRSGGRGQASRESLL
ncbi:hypothetical protein [Streptomyces sp. NPDC060035]|uniref:hypothetical protein n=1 Tax=Streptomyces sp. NPDC060035 TaxID=3347044 RepID=UPI0036935D47